MAQSIYITSAEGHSGKSTVALGVLDALSHATARVGVFRAIARSTIERDYVLEMLLDHDGVDLPYDDCIGVTYDDVRQDPDAALATIVERYKAVEAQCDAVVIVGSDDPSCSGCVWFCAERPPSTSSTGAPRFAAMRAL